MFPGVELPQRRADDTSKHRHIESIRFKINDTNKNSSNYLRGKNHRAKLTSAVYSSGSSKKII